MWQSEGRKCCKLQVLSQLKKIGKQNMLRNVSLHLWFQKNVRIFGEKYLGSRLPYVPDFFHVWLLVTQLAGAHTKLSAECGNIVCQENKIIRFHINSLSMIVISNIQFNLILQLNRNRNRHTFDTLTFLTDN